MSQPTHIKSFKSPSAIEGRKVVTFGAADGEVVTATAPTNTLIGISEQIGSRDNDRVDVVIAGICEAKAGGNITRGEYLTVNGSGDVVAASASTDRIVGMAMQNGVANDVIDVLIERA